MANDTAPVFFYSTEDNTCAARGFTFNATNNTSNGDLCAYISAAPTRDLWACPAPDTFVPRNTSLRPESRIDSLIQVMLDHSQAMLR
jgi:hypothetical protein